MNNKIKPKIEKSPPKTCGIIMPISGMGDCGPSHWVEVKEILETSVRAANCEPILVSHGEDVGIIQRRIVENLYKNEIVICDVSFKNPNVMFELGMRLAFDKPTIIIKDDETTYPFDTSPLEYIEYPRDLRFSKIIEFNNLLTKKLISTLSATSKDPSGRFLSSFGEFKSVELKSSKVSANEYLIDEISKLRADVSRLTSVSTNRYSAKTQTNFDWDICLDDANLTQARSALKIVEDQKYISKVTLNDFDENHFHLDVKLKPMSPSFRSRRAREIEELIRQDTGMKYIHVNSERFR